ncbi:MAG: DUF2062 domain-containing protein [Lentisphaerota bacterium]
MVKWHSWKAYYHFIMRQRGTPEAVARGVGIGTFVSMSPFFGIHMLIAFAIAWIFKANRTAAIIMTWVTNVFTVVPIFAFTYSIGERFVPPQLRGHIGKLKNFLHHDSSLQQLFDLPGHFHAIMKFGAEIMLPLTIGGILVGGVAGLISYQITLVGVRRYKIKKAERLHRKRQAQQLQHTPL